MDSENFWQIIETEMDLVVPTYIKNIFHHLEIEKPELLREFSSDSWETLEEKIKSEEYRKSLPDDSNLSDYYGTYTAETTSFRFSDMDRSTINRIADLAKHENPFFRQSKTLSRTTSNQLKTLIAKIPQSDSSLVQLILKSYVNNVSKNPHGYRYDNSIKMFFSFCY